MFSLPRASWLLFTVLLLIILTPQSITRNTATDIDPVFKPHSPITIIGDKDFIFRNGVISGSGTPDDPYIIKGWEINASDSDYGIYVRDTTAYFIIIYCRIYGANLYGIYLENVKHAKIINNIVMSNNLEGIFLIDSNNNMIYNNEIINNRQDGLYLRFSSNNIIYSNNITDNRRGIFLLNSSNNMIHDNNILGNEYSGICFEGSDNNIVYINNIEGNNFEGLYIWGSTNNTIYNNNIVNNYGGLYILNSYNNLFYHNNFINNSKQVYSYNATTIWNMNYPVGGNYWSDYNGTDQYRGIHQNVSGSDGIGDQPYPIWDRYYKKHQYDYYPLIHPIKINITINTLTISPKPPFPLFPMISDSEYSVVIFVIAIFIIVAFIVTILYRFYGNRGSQD